MASRSNLKKYLPIGLAVAAGAALLYWSRKASAMPLPPAPTPEDEPSGGGGGQPSGGGGGGSNVNAPPFQSRTVQANSVIDSYYTEWLGALGVAMDNAGNPGPATMDNMRAAKAQLGIPSGRTPGSWFTDETMRDVYGLQPGSVPNNANNTWQPWMNEWNRVWNRFKSRPLDPTA